jgi:hypothetical protein
LVLILAALCAALHHIATHKSNKINGRNESVPIPKLDVAGSIPVSRSTEAQQITHFTFNSQLLNQHRAHAFNFDGLFCQFFVIVWQQPFTCAIRVFP